MKLKFYFYTALLTFISLSLFAQASAQSVTGSIAVANRGSSARGAVVITIPGGLHVNSSRPNSQYAIATSVRLSGAGVKVGAVRYPRGKNRKFSFSDTPINVYEGRTVFPFTVNIPANFKGNIVRINAVVQFQACTEEVCYPPKTKKITFTAKVG